MAPAASIAALIFNWVRRPAVRIAAVSDREPDATCGASLAASEPLTPKSSNERLPNQSTNTRNAPNRSDPRKPRISGVVTIAAAIVIAEPATPEPKFQKLRLVQLKLR